MDYFKELMRIADSLEKNDADIVRSAAIQLIPSPTPAYESVDKIEGWGYQHTRMY